MALKLIKHAVELPSRKRIPRPHKPCSLGGKRSLHGTRPVIRAAYADHNEDVGHGANLLRKRAGAVKDGVARPFVDGEPAERIRIAVLARLAARQHVGMFIHIANKLVLSNECRGKASVQLQHCNSFYPDREAATSSPARAVLARSLRNSRWTIWRPPLLRWKLAVQQDKPGVLRARGYLTAQFRSAKREDCLSTGDIPVPSAPSKISNRRDARGHRRGSGCSATDPSCTGAARRGCTRAGAPGCWGCRRCTCAWRRRWPPRRSDGS